jgi:hypothetical protein
MRRALQVSAALVVSMLAVACQRSHEVLIANLLEVSAVVEISQYRSEGFDGTPPGTFQPNLLIETRSITVGPNERATVAFTDGSGGFWLRWRVVAPTPNAAETFTLDLLRDSPSITVRPMATK